MRSSFWQRSGSRPSACQSSAFSSPVTTSDSGEVCAGIRASMHLVLDRTGARRRLAHPPRLAARRGAQPAGDGLRVAHGVGGAHEGQPGVLDDVLGGLACRARWRGRRATARGSSCGPARRARTRRRHASGGTRPSRRRTAPRRWGPPVRRAWSSHPHRSSRTSIPDTSPALVETETTRAPGPSPRQPVSAGGRVGVTARRTGPGRRRRPPGSRQPKGRSEFVCTQRVSHRTEM